MVGVGHVDVRVSVEQVGEDLERLGREHVVVVDEDHEPPGCRIQRIVRRGDDPAVDAASDHDTARLRLEVVEHPANVGSRRCIVDDHVLDLPGVGLRCDRGQTGLEVDRLRVEDRRQHAEAWAHRPRFNLGTTDIVQRCCARSSRRSHPDISMRRCRRS